MITKIHLKTIFAIAINVGIFSFLGIIALVILWHNKLKPFQDYALVIDAGSTHSKIFVYTWPADKSDGIGLTSRVHQIKSCSVHQGAITTVVNATFNNVKQYFDEAMTKCINEIPKTRRSRTLIFLGATAGLRLANITNPSYINSLLTSTRSYFNSLGLLFRAPENQVRIISGSEEGLSGWISTNILMKQLYDNNKPLETYGVSDMGGASTQISFISPNATSELFTMDLFNTNYDVYSHSYLCYGQEQTRLLYLGQLVKQANDTYEIDDPCLQHGYIQNMTYEELFHTACARGEHAPSANLSTSAIFSFIGTGEYKECKTMMEQRFDKTSCSSSDCGFNGVYQPVPIPPSSKFVAISGFYNVFHNIAPNISLLPNEHKNYNLTSVNFTQIKHAIKEICKQSWKHVHKPDDHRPFLCFRAMYHWTLFEYGYSMTDENLKNFQIIKTIDSDEIGWTLGYMINQTNYLDPDHRPTRLINQGEFIGLLVLCIVCFILSSISIGFVIYKYKIHKKQWHDEKTDVFSMK